MDTAHRSKWMERDSALRNYENQISQVLSNFHSEKCPDSARKRNNSDVWIRRFAIDLKSDLISASKHATVLSQKSVNRRVTEKLIVRCLFPERTSDLKSPTNRISNFRTIESSSFATIGISRRKLESLRVRGELDLSCDSDYEVNISDFSNRRPRVRTRPNLDNHASNSRNNVN